MALEKAKYAVIDESLVRQCIFIPRNVDADDRKQDETEKLRREMQIKDIEHLMFSFKGLRSISNLVGLHALKKLQLDNNQLTRIENLDDLPNLQWLDLSFNQIERIEGLDALANLTDLILYSNRITKLENLDALTNLECLSIGRNGIQKYDELMYLRRFRRLRLLTVEGNPLCASEDATPFILAHLAKLRFLDYRLVQKHKVEEAQDRFRNSLLELEAQDQKEKEERQIAKTIKKEEAQFEKANMSGIVTLYTSLFRDDPEASRMGEIMPLFSESLEGYKARFEEAKQALATEMFRLYREKEMETEDFDAVINGASDEKNAQAKALIKDFERKLKQVLIEVSAHENSLQEDEQRLLELKAENDRMAEHLLEMEVVRVEQFSTVYEEYQQAVEHIKELCIDAIRQNMERMREEEKVALSEMEKRLQVGMDLAATEEGEQTLLEMGVTERGVQLLRDKELIQRTLKTSHENRIEMLMQKEVELVKREEAMFAELKTSLSERDHRQNRSRVTEIWMWVDRNAREIDEELVPIQEELGGDADPYHYK